MGSYLNVHEGPVGISWRPYPDDPGLQPGMFLSNGIKYITDILATYTVNINITRQYY